ncbi:MAG: glycoside hydrolase family 92 protein, partial [Clostridia bacterium]|nr:glycoside hydrolase family 92 protein [Clostridia bacterium]
MLHCWPQNRADCVLLFRPARLCSGTQNRTQGKYKVFRALHTSQKRKLTASCPRGSQRRERPARSICFAVWSIFSLWDTYRAEHPFMNIIQPQRSADMVQSMIRHQQ